MLIHRFACGLVSACLLAASNTFAQEVQTKQLTPKELERLEALVGAQRPSIVSIVCKTEIQAERFVRAYFADKLSFGQVAERMKTEFGEPVCFYWDMSILEKQETKQVETPDGTFKILKVTLNGVWVGNGNMFMPLKPHERYIVEGPPQYKR